MAILAKERKHPLADGRSGTQQVVTVVRVEGDDTRDITYVVTVVKHAASNASAPWRKPATWTTAEVHDTNGRELWSCSPAMRVAAGIKAEDVLVLAGLVTRAELEREAVTA